MKRVKVGDIIEISTVLGLSYAQYTHFHREYGELLRVFAQKYTERPIDICKILDGDLQLTCFLPLYDTVKFGMVEVVGRCAVPKSLTAFPLFRTGVADQITLKVKSWSLWDGERSWRVGDLTPEQRYLPMRGVWNHAYLVDRIVEGWRAETDPR